MSRARPRNGLAWGLAIGAVAVFLRCWRLAWGLGGGGRNLGFPDEILSWLPYVRDFTPLACSSFDRTDLHYPTLYGYALGLATAFLRFVGVVEIADPAHPFLHPSAAALLVGRGVSVAAGLTTVAVAGVLAGRLFSRRAGFLAAALMAVVPFEVLYSHLVSPDILLTTCMATALLFACATADGGGLRHAAAAGFAAGAATATKYTGLAIVVAVAWAVAEQAFRRRSARPLATLGTAALAGFALAMLLGCPPCVLHPERVLTAMRMLEYLTSNHASAFHNQILVPSLGWYARPYVYQLVASLPYALGWPLYLAALGGVAVAAATRSVADRVLLAGILPYFLVMAGSMLVYPRYLLPILPALVVLAARAIDRLGTPRVAVTAASVVFASSFAVSASQVSRFSLDQQQEVAAWLAGAARQQGLAKATVGVPQMTPDYFRLSGPLESKGLVQVELEDGRWFEDATDFFVLPHWYETAIERDMPGTEAAADLAKLRSGQGGYRKQASWSSSWWSEDLYTAVDPAFAADLWQGEIGFTVYARTAGVEP